VEDWELFVKVFEVHCRDRVRVGESVPQAGPALSEYSREMKWLRVCTELGMTKRLTSGPGIALASAMIYGDSCHPRELCVWRFLTVSTHRSC
jgi:hypothetical protein